MSEPSRAIPWAKPTVGKEELEEVIDSFEANWLTRGPKVRRFEKALAEFVDVPFAIALSNGSAALDIALKTLGVGMGDEVIVPAMTYFATAAAVSYQSGIPVFVDIENASFNLDPARIAEAITRKTKAIIFIDYGGNPANFDEIAKVAQEHGIPVLHDAAQSLGTLYKGRAACGQTPISTMSFHMAKVMTTVEGGMIFTHDENYRDQVLMRMNQGEPPGGKYKHVVLGTNARMMDLQAAIGLAQFKKLPSLLAERKRVAAKYNELFAQTVRVRTVSTLRENSQNSYFFYPVLIDDRDRIAEVLRQEYKIDTRIAYPMPVFRQEVYSKGHLDYRCYDCPVAEEVTARILNLPIFPGMTSEMIERVVYAIKSELG